MKSKMIEKLISNSGYVSTIRSEAHDELAELKRLAEIGRATEKAFGNQKTTDKSTLLMITKVTNDELNPLQIEFLYSLNDLLEWSESGGE